MNAFEIHIEDLKDNVKKELIDFLGGDNGNYDVVPLAVITEAEADQIREEARA